MARPQVGVASSRPTDAITRAEATALIRPAINEQGSSYAFNASDMGRAVHSTATAAVTYTVPISTSVAWAVGTIILVAQMNTGRVTLAGESGVTLRTSTSLATRTQYSEISLRYLGSDVWLVAGDLA